MEITIFTGACVSSGDPTIYPNFNCIQYEKVLIQKMLLTNKFKLYLKLNLHRKSLSEPFGWYSMLPTSPPADIEFMRNRSYSVEWARRIKSGSGLDSLIDCVDFKLILMLWVCWEPKSGSGLDIGSIELNWIVSLLRSPVVEILHPTQIFQCIPRNSKTIRKQTPRNSFLNATEVRLASASARSSPQPHLTKTSATPF